MFYAGNRCPENLHDNFYQVGLIHVNAM